jgi:peptidoglycan/xylan/chitin deacetylase (PgdA/CDA1 family)
VAIRLDDGGSRHYSHIYPLLAAYGIKASICLPSSVVGAAHGMTAAAINELIAAGWEVCQHGPHSPIWTTANYATPADLRTALETDWAALDTALGGSVLPSKPRVCALPTSVVSRALLTAFDGWCDFLSYAAKGSGAADAAGIGAQLWYTGGSGTGHAWTRFSWIKLAQALGLSKLLTPLDGNLVSDVVGFEQLAHYMVASNGICLTNTHAYDYDASETLPWVTDEDIAARLADWAAGIEYLIDHGAIFLTLGELLSYIMHPKSPHLIQREQELISDDWESVKPAGTSYCWSNPGTRTAPGDPAGPPSGSAFYAIGTNTWLTIQSPRVIPTTGCWLRLSYWGKGSSGALPGAAVQGRVGTTAVTGWIYAKDGSGNYPTRADWAEVVFYVYLPSKLGTTGISVICDAVGLMFINGTSPTGSAMFADPRLTLLRDWTDPDVRPGDDVIN